jgi:hypothetical protein
MSATKSELSTQAKIARNSTIERAISLLGSGLNPEIVANTLGVTAGYISQLMSQTDIASEVTALRYEALQKHNTRDLGYDALEDALLEKMRDLLPLMHRPMEILKALSVINAAKRRGQSAPETIHNQQTIVQLILPTSVIQSFQVDTKNSVIKTGEQELLTISPKHLLATVKGNIQDDKTRDRDRTGNRTGSSEGTVQERIRAAKELRNSATKNL